VEYVDLRIISKVKLKPFFNTECVHLLKWHIAKIHLSLCSIKYQVMKT